MCPESGLLNKGKISLERDLLPIIEELKAKWKRKAGELHQEKERHSSELVEQDITLRGLQEDIRRLVQALEGYQEEGSFAVEARGEYDRVRTAVEQLIKEIEGVAKQTAERGKQVKETIADIEGVNK